MATQKEQIAELNKKITLVHQDVVVLLNVVRLSMGSEQFLALQNAVVSELQKPPVNITRKE
jgi:hypothetical protein